MALIWWKITSEYNSPADAFPPAANVWTIPCVNHSLKYEFLLILEDLFWDSHHWLDVAIFQEQVKRVVAKLVATMQTLNVQTLEEALQLYTDDLLEGFYND